MKMTKQEYYVKQLYTGAQELLAILNGKHFNTVDEFLNFDKHLTKRYLPAWLINSTPNAKSIIAEAIQC